MRPHNTRRPSSRYRSLTSRSAQQLCPCASSLCHLSFVSVHNDSTWHRPPSHRHQASQETLTPQLMLQLGAAARGGHSQEGGSSQPAAACTGQGCEQLHHVLLVPGLHSMCSCTGASCHQLCVTAGAIAPCGADLLCHDCLDEADQLCHGQRRLQVRFLPALVVAH